MSNNDIVISGMSGRFPMSRNVDEFSKNLFNGVDMVTTAEDRWPEVVGGSINRMGRVPDFNLFDANYFGLMGQMVEILDPESKLLLETTHEAIIDAGINPQTLRGTRTGVYIGVSTYPMTDGYPASIQKDSAKSVSTIVMSLLGNIKALYANRISFAYDFHGPSLITDTACSASLTAFNLAVNDLKLGHTDYAIVGGTHMTLQPFIPDMQLQAGLCSPRGISAVLDESADGFVKADATVCLLLQRRSTAKRVYATVMSSRVNSDGRKTIGMFCPSSEAQESLMVMAYKDAGIDPLELTFVEAHLTATKVGDPKEVKAIYNAYFARTGRKEPLILGLLKSNIGHTEGASGIAAIIKVLLSYENESIPPNIHLKKIRKECEEYCPPLYPNTEVLKYQPGLASINNFGIGGVNGNVLIEPNYKLTNEDNLKIAETIPRIVNICGRTEEAVKHLFNFIENNPKKISRDFLALLTDTMKYVPNVNSEGLPHRGSIIIKKISEDKSGIKYEYKKQISEVNSKTLKPIWFLFPGLGGQWPAMAKALMPIKVFADKIEECSQILSEFGINLKHLLLSEDKNAISTMTAKFCSTTSIELALFEVLKSLNIIPDGIIGHSFGEIACAYADGCITTKQAMVITFYRGFITENDMKIPRGSMIVCGLTKAEAKKLMPPEVVFACYNAKNSTVLSGPEKQMNELISELKRKNIFCHQLKSSDIPYHSKYLKTSAQPMINKIKEYIPSPIKRSEKWISTSVLNTEEEVLKCASAEYFVTNLISPVYFYDQFKELPSDAIIIEIGPHGVFRKIVVDTLDSTTYISLIKKDSNETNLDNFLSAVATLYGLGFNPSIENLYPSVEWPVSRSTASIGSLMKWDHRVEYKFKRFPDHYNRSTASDMNITVDVSDSEDKVYSGHYIDGTVLFPATGYLMLAWRKLASVLNKSWKEVPVVFDSVQFMRPIFLSETNKTFIKVRYDAQTYDFHILENDNICCTGKIYSPDDNTLLLQHIIHEKQNSIQENEFQLETEDIYKELRCMGYDYCGEFQRLKSVGTTDFTNFSGICEWNGNLVTFLDAMLQSFAFCAPYRKLMVPVMVRNVRIDPIVLFDYIRRNRVNEDDSQEFMEKEHDQQTQQIIETSIKADEKIELTMIKKRKEDYNVFRSNLPIYYNIDSQVLLTHGIEFEELFLTPIPRKLETNNLVLDSYEFIANFDNNAIDENVRKEMIEYIEVCKSMAAKLKLNCLKNMKCDFNYQNISPDLLNSYRQKNNENHVLFKIFDNIHELSFDENQNQNELTQNSLKIVKDDLKNYNIENDIINMVTKNQRLFRTTIEIVSENFVPKKELIVTEINLTSELLAKEVKQYMGYFQLLPTNVDYNLRVKSTEYVSEEFADKAIVWKPNESLEIEQSNMVILRDNYDLWQLNMSNLIKKIIEKIIPNGFLMIVSKTRLTEPELALNSLNLNGNSNSNSDLEKRLNDILEAAQTALNLICVKTDSIGTTALLFRKVEANKKIPENDQIIEITGERNEKWFQLIKDKLNFAKESDNKTDNVWLIARDSNINGITGLIKCLRYEPGGENLRCIYDYDCQIKLPIDWNSNPFSDILKNDLVINVIKEGKLGTYRNIKLAKDCNKVVSNEYFLNITQTRDLSSLHWFDLRNIKPNNEAYDFMGNKIKQVAIKIYSSGLTFHDVMTATGRIPSGHQLIYTDCLVGCEFAGRRADSGERVMGLEMTRCFATSIDANANLISLIPDHWSMDDAITILSTYSTSWYGLIKKANLEKGESILIHSGAGGVGQSAINICKHYNCDIYVTVGNEEKKRFLMNEYNIPENRIFSSRDIQFKYKIKELTKGKGVDIVLNSLAGEKLIASYQCLANRGRFVELGKVDLVMNKKLGMFDFIRDISFIAVGVDVCLMENQSDFAIKFFDWMHQNCNNGCVKPLNKTVFNANEAEKAFRYMTTGKHIGKIVLKIRDEEINKYPMTRIKRADDLVCVGKIYFNPNKVYIITGGLGGFGLELIHWMMYMGARKFVLTSRSGIKTNYQKFVVNRLRNFGQRNKFYKVMVEISKNDCLTIESAKQVISEASLMGQIGGVFHSSLVLKDCFIQDLDFDNFCEPIDTKYKVFNNLDIVSRKLSYNLDYFVVFSSLSCGKGNGGQSSYGFGNSLCERICEKRINEGQHGLAIQYGPIGDVGVLADVNQVLQFSSLQKQRINSCCDVLDKLLSIKQPIVTSFVKAAQYSSGGIKNTGIIKELWKALGIDPDTTPGYLTLGEIGLESMFAIEMQQEFEREFNINLSLNQIKLTTVKMLRDYENGKYGDIERYVESIKRSKKILSQMKFLIPSETHTRLNAVKTGKPIYFMPPFEITYSSIELLVKNFDRPVIGLNWTKDIKFESIKDINNYYIDLIKKLEPSGKCDMVGYFDGAFTIAKLIRKGMVNRAVIIDMIPDKRIQETIPTDDTIIKFLFGFLTNGLPFSLIEKLMRDIKSEPDMNSKIRKIVTEIKEMAGRQLIATDLEEIMQIAVKRIHIISKYMIQKRKKFANKLKEKIGIKWAKKTGKLRVIKPFKFDKDDDQDEQLAETRNFYLLPEENESKELVSIEALDSENPFDVSSEIIGEKILEAFI